MFRRLLSSLVVAAVSFAVLPLAVCAETVTASYYSAKYNGRRTTSGQRFSSKGTRVKLTNPRNRRSVIVQVNDRGRFVKGRDISVTRRAAKQLGFTRSGVAQLEMETLK
jgi:rare lipoprotein A